MSWASRRRFLITAIGAAFILTVLAFILIPTFYRAPSCADNSQNQGERGIDCGGPCPYLCTEQELPPTVLFTQAVSPAAGRTDVISYVENQNPDAAAANVPYHIALYASDHTLVAKSDGVIDLLPPGARVPVFAPELFSGTRSVAEAFLTLEPASILWFSTSDTRLLPSVGHPDIGGSLEAPRITASLTNPGVLPMRNVKVVAVVFDDEGNVIAASQTVIAAILPGKASEATFTWGSAFSRAPTRIDILPLVPLSS